VGNFFRPLDCPFDCPRCLTALAIYAETALNEMVMKITQAAAPAMKQLPSVHNPIIMNTCGHSPTREALQPLKVAHATAVLGPRATQSRKQQRLARLARRSGQPLNAPMSKRKKLNASK